MPRPLPAPRAPSAIAPAIALAASLAASLLLAAPARAAENDYPTAARVDYVIGCMASNGGDQVAMRRCACAIDAIAEQMPYERYERAETALRMAEGGGQGTVFRETPFVRTALDALRAAQSEANLRCS